MPGPIYSNNKVNAPLPKKIKPPGTYGGNDPGDMPLPTLPSARLGLIQEDMGNDPGNKGTLPMAAQSSRYGIPPIRIRDEDMAEMQQEPVPSESYFDKISNLFSRSTPVADQNKLAQELFSSKSKQLPTAEKAKATPTATDTTQATPAPQGDDFQGRMAATAFGNVLASLGAGMAGYSPASVNQMFQGLYGQLNQRQREKEERDPNSTISKNYREMIAPYVPKGLDLSNKSAFDLKQTLPFMMSRLEREEQRAFQANENAKDRAIKKEIYQSMVGQRNVKRSDDAFKILKNDAEKVYDASSARGILSDVNNAISVIEKAEKEGKSLTMSRVKGSLGVFGDPFGMRDPDLNMLGTLKNSVITKLNKLSGDNVISNNDRQMYIEDFPAINSGGLKQHLVNLRNSIYEQRKLQKDKLNLYTNAVNEQYGTNFNSDDLFNLDIGENQNKAQEDKPKFRR